MRTFGFIGCGNMGGALARAVKASGVKGENIFLHDIDTNKRDKLANELTANVCELESISKCDFLFLGVKPQNIRETLGSLKPYIGGHTTIVSMAAGVETATIISVLGEIPLIRIMPNTPVSVGSGVVLFCCVNISDVQKEVFIKSLEKSADLVEIPERQMDAGSAVSGCGPAFGYMFIEAMADGAVKCGMTRDEAIKLSAETLRGAAEMVLKTGEHPEKLKDNVCSPGGSTITGVHSLEEGNFRGTVMNCIIKAYEKTKELSK